MMMMAAHRGSMHKTREDAAYFTTWFAEHGYTASRCDLTTMARDCITDGFSSLFTGCKPEWWCEFFVMLWDMLTDEERIHVNRRVAYRDVVCEDKLVWCHGLLEEARTGCGDDDDDGCPGREHHPLEGDIGQRMIINMHDYCLGRMTYMPEVCVSWLNEWWHYVTPVTRYRLLVRTGQALLTGRAGANCDAVSWHAFFMKGRAELDETSQMGLMHDVLYGPESIGQTANDYIVMLGGDLSKAVFKWNH